MSYCAAETNLTNVLLMQVCNTSPYIHNTSRKAYSSSEEEQSSPIDIIDIDKSIIEGEGTSHLNFCYFGIIVTAHVRPHDKLQHSHSSVYILLSRHFSSMQDILKSSALILVSYSNGRRQPPSQSRLYSSPVVPLFLNPIMLLLRLNCVRAQELFGLTADLAGFLYLLCRCDVTSISALILLILGKMFAFIFSVVLSRRKIALSCCTFNLRYCVGIKAQCLIHEEDKKASGSSGSSGAGQTPSVKLPIISLPEFDGSFDHWLEYRDTFQSLVHKCPSISKIQKFHYLKSTLKVQLS
ncbi:hypothetical protein NE865_16316 [Phthorimaea operculella]|nr:hypothetical protein NE865_16316 [Phthorimaea operculella]